MKKLKLAKYPLHNSKVKREIEYLLEGSPNAERIRSRLSFREREELMKKLEVEFPVILAARKTNAQISKLIKERATTKSERKTIKRYFKRARDAVFGKYKFKTVYGKIPARKKKYTYHEYINSPLWASRRARFFQENGRKCTVCTATSKIHLHHMVYTAFDGNEPDKNLVALCDEHHKMYHDRYGSSGNMRQTTYLFIEEMKSGVSMEGI